MRTKEKLERSRWYFKQKLDYCYEIYARNKERLIYNTLEERVIAYFHIFDGNFHLVDDIEFEILTEKTEKIDINEEEKET